VPVGGRSRAARLGSAPRPRPGSASRGQAGRGP
jgi:hypothetical protein